MGSILDDIDIQLESDDAIKYIIMQFIKDNYEFYMVDEMFNIHIVLKNNVTISDEPNKDGKYEVSSVYKVSVINFEIEHLTNELFVWKKAKRFDCGRCGLLKSLDGAPKEVGEHFYCDNCNSLKSLEGAPQKVGSGFYCYGCDSLKSLEGAPKEVGGIFSCHDCHKLTSLKGAPKEVGGDFNCSFCKSLESLDGAPKEVGGHFYCDRCEDNFTKDAVKAVCNIAKEKIHV